MKFSILDRELFRDRSGVRGDLNTVLRQAGFSLCANETQVNQTRAYSMAVSRGLTVEEAEAAQIQAREALFFYSPTIPFNRERLRSFVPALRDTDFQRVAVSSVKHYDFMFADEELARSFIRQQQNLDGAEAGVFYTTSRDRELTAQWAGSHHSLHELLEYRDLPPADARGIAFDGVLSGALAFHPVADVERSVRRQTIGIDGMPLRAPSMQSAFIGFATREAAVAANGGTDDGVEQVEVPFGIPFGFASDDARMIVLKDARYLEFNEMEFPELEAGLASNVQRNRDFLSHVQRVVDAYESLRADNLLDSANWSSLPVAADVKARFEQIFSDMKAALAPVMPHQGFFTVEALAAYGGQRTARFADHFPAGFLRFVDDFRTNLYNAAQRRHDELTAEVSFRAGMQRVMQAVMPTNQAAAKREDAGEKIGGARKDYAQRALARSEVASLSPRERIDIVTKDNVWPKLDMAAMRDSGVEPHVAFVIREFRHALPATPCRGGRNRKRILLERRAAEPLTDERCDSFIKAVELVRDCLSTVKTEADLHRACFEIRKASDLPIELRPINADGSDRTRLYSGESTYYFWDSDHWFFDGAGQKFTDALPNVVFEEASGRARAGYALVRKLEAARVSTDGGWNWAIKERRASSDEDGAQRKVERVEPVVPHLDDIRRVGPDHREDAAVDEAAFMAAFGFRGVEYGKWLPQNERQMVLNHAYDAFMDLAEVMGMPPRAMSLGGELAVAFGSRGSGGKQAPAAHYEPGRRVMNLTRLNGAGFLAHEWWHAFDDWLARASGLSASHFATELATRARTARVVRTSHMPEAISDLAGLLTLAKSVPMPLNEVLQQHSSVEVHSERVSIDAFVERRLQDWIASLDKLLPEDRRDGAFKGYALAQLEKHWVDVDGFDGVTLRRIDDGEKLVAGIAEAMDAAFGSPDWRQRSSTIVTRADFTISVQERILKKLTDVRDGFTPGKYRKDSVYFRDALYYDDFRSKPYWSTDVELSARMFETWVQDNVSRERGRRSDYLVYGRDDRVKAEHWGYPRGIERRVIAAALDNYFETHRADLLHMLDDPEIQKRTSLRTMRDPVESGPS
ncbi:LPD1 domain-containing protein [Burkholderia sp. Tr-20390]|uniref:LPD1 domain-containing protein n=1 Tax=Burkholderia sp. Tr-20390 TaxID=2703904 RepID=UPI001F121EB1|nr:LPD1 domain-containing protein [Burkholderia sp. Tr-20390]